MPSRRILITGVSSALGGRLAQQLERDRAVEAIIGVDTADPQHELERTEFVRVDADEALLRRILGAAEIDTVIDTRLVADSIQAPPPSAHACNVIGTRNLLMACSGSSSPVRKLVFKSSAHVYGSDPDAPAFLGEGLDPPPRAASEVERYVVAAEQAVADFAAANPRVQITVLRLADAIGGSQRGAHLVLLGLPMIPALLGFDPRFQFIHEEDAIGVLAHAVQNDLAGAFNAAADGVLALSEIAGLLGKPLLPVLPPWGTVFAARQLRRVGLPIPVEILGQLRHGRGLDNRRLKATGYVYGYTTREAVLKLRAQQRLRPLLGSGAESYRYEREVEEFLRWSPNVQASSQAARDSSATYDDLGEDELIALISSLERRALLGLRHQETATHARSRVIDAIDRALARSH